MAGFLFAAHARMFLYNKNKYAMLRHLKHIFIPHAKNGYRPHAIRRHGLAIAILLIVFSQASFNFATANQFQVLGYATNVSSGDLLSFTNSNRAGSGLAGLTLNTQLNAAAQSKANHMIANDYWSHVAPDGTTPWFFFEQAGYSYSRAGENLAYGFSTSSGVVQGWMNSPSHAANILDTDFTEVGFGIANGANFQGGENTVVVALYAKPLTTATTTPPASQQTTAEPEPTPEPTPTIVEAIPEPIPELQEASELEQEADNTEAETALKPEAEAAEEGDEQADQLDQRYLARVSEDGTLVVTGSPVPAQPGETITSNLDAIVSGQAHWALYLTMGVLSSLAVIYFVRHMQMLYQLAVKGEHYIEGHPLLEASIIYTLIWLVLAASFGAIL